MPRIQPHSIETFGFVTFGGELAKQCQRVNGNLLTVETPPHSPGKVSVAVENPGDGNTTSADGFEYK